MAAITLDIGANTRQAEKDIQKLVSRSYNINLNTKGDQPLGRITGKVNEFSKSLDASNARVIAFGASAGIIFGLERAFTALVSSTIEVQKSLQDINVILNVSAQNLQKFGAELFGIARNTGQSFQEVAKAATEFSRQGLGVEETLKRTNEALILSRLSGLDTAKSVEALTAAVNSFASQAVTATEIVNKFANVDAAFAVSSADLADAIARVGSSAAQSGVSLNELIAIVTSAQQTTARGGAVIGNSFKTIFTRLQREKVVDLLGSLGISGTDSSGQVKSTIQLLTDLGKVYDTLGSQQQAYVAEQVGGVFQINILKAALADLGKEYSIYGSALNVAAGATDQAIRRNEELNKTYASQINALQENARQLAAAGGERLLGPSIDRLVGGTNSLLSGFNESDGQNVGTVLGKGILDGIGQFIAGPGLALIGGVLLKLFRDLAKFATGSVQQLLGLNTAATQQRDLQTSIQQILSKNPKLIELALKGEQGLNAAANSLLASLQKQTVELQKQAQVAQQISKAFVSQAGVRMAGGVPVVPTKRTGKATGYIPNFASDKLIEKYTAISLGATSSVRPHMSQGTIGGKKFVMNNQEVEFPDVGKNGDSMVLPTYGDGPRIAAAGFIPNFQKGAQTPKEIVVAGSKKYGYLIPSTAPGRLSTPDKPIPGGTVTDTANNVKYVFPPQTAYGPKLIGEAEASNKLENQIYQSVLNRTASYTKRLAPPGKPVSPSDLEKGFQSAKGARGAILSAIGAAFEVGITTALGYEAASSNTGAGDFDVRSGKGIEKIQSLFGIGGITKADFKATTGGDSVTSFRKKILREEFGFGGAKKGAGPTGKQLKERGLTSGFRRKAFAGFIPNFAAIQAPLQNAVNNEIAAGALPNQVRIDKNSKLKTSLNPDGLGIWSKKYEGSLPEGIRMAEKAGINPKTKGMPKAGGYIPNFAIEDPDMQGTSAGTAATAIIAQLSGIAFAFAFTGNQFKDSLKELANSNRAAARQAIEELRTRKAAGEQLTQAEIQRAADSRKVGGGQKIGAFLSSNALGLSIAAPILGETIKNIAGQETATERGIGATGSALGQIGSFAATGGLIGGGPGAAIGTAVGALLTVPDVINQFTSTLPDLTNAAKKASQDLTKFSDVSQRLLTTSASLKDLNLQNAPPDKLKKTQDEFVKTLSELNPAERARIDSAIKLNKLEEELAKITQEKIDKEKSTSTAEALGIIEERKQFGIFAGGFDPSTKQGKEDAKIIRKSFNELFTADKTPEESLARLNKAASLGIPQLTELAESAGQLKKAQDLYGGSTQQLSNILESIVPQADPAGGQEAIEERSNRIKALVAIADDDIPGFINLVKELIGTLADDPAAIKKAEEALKNYQKSIKEEEKNKKAATEATNQIVESLERNIRVAQAAAEQNRRNAQAEVKFRRETLFADAFTRPTETVGTIVGQGAPLAESFALRERVAKIGFDQIQNIEGVKIDFVKSINDSIIAAFDGAVQETIEQAPKEGTSKEIEKANKEILKPLAQQQEKAFGVVQNVLNKTLEPGKEINTEALLKDINNSLITANIDAKVREKIITQLRESAINGNNLISDFRNAAIREFKTVAKEQSQRILIAKIQQAQKFGGGVDQFITEQEPGQSLFDQVIKSTKGFEKFYGSNLKDGRFNYRSGTNDFQYNYGAAQRARQEMAPEFGRSALQLIDQLQAFTGYTPNPEGKASQAGVAGLKEFYDRQIKELEKIAKDSGTPQIVKDEITASLREVSRLGGTENIAKLQVAQRTGALTESAFQEITGKFQNPVLEALREQAKSIKNPEERARLEEEIKNLSSDLLVSSDPTVKAIQVTNNILKQLLTKGFGIEYNPLLSVSTPVKTDSKARGYLPAFNEESRAISRGVGGAKAGDRPKFIPNLNGIPAFVNTGEQLVDNFMGSGETAVLTRDMQNAIVAAKGFIPNFAEPSPELLKRFLEVVDDPEEFKKLIKPFAADFQMLGRSGFEMSPDRLKEVVDIGVYNPTNKKVFKKFSYQDLLDLGLFKETQFSNPAGRGGKIEIRNVLNYEKVIDELIPKARQVVSDDLAKQTAKSAAAKAAQTASGSGAKTSITEIVEDAAKSSAPETSNKPIKPSELGGGKGKNASKIVEDTFRSGFKRVTDTSTYIDDITRASQEEVSNLAVKKAEEAAAKQAAEKATAKAAEKAGGNVAGKVAGKAVGKSVIKKIPLVGIAAGVGFGIGRALEGDFTGAGLEVASGVAGTLPVAGTAASVGIDAALAVRDIQTATAEAQKQAGIDAKARGSARGRKQTLEEKKLSEENKQQAIDKARYEFSTAFNKNWPLNSKDQQEFAKLWSGKPANETIPDFIKRIKESAPKQNYKTNITKATKDDIDRFYGRGKYAPLGSKERTDYENKSKISGLIADNQRAKFGVELNEETPLFKDPIQENIDKGAKASQALKPTIKSETVGVINGRPAIEWENDAKIDAMDDAVKRGEISQENADKALEAEISKKTIENRRKQRSQTTSDTQKTSVKPKSPIAERIDKRIEESRRKLAEGQKLLGQTGPVNTETTTKPKSSYPGGISPETARAIVQELDATYNEAIRKSKSPRQAQSWAQTQQRYRLLYSRGQYAELDAFYKSLRKGPGYNQNYGQGTGRPGESVQNLASGFIPNFAQNYISNLAGLEAGLSGETPAMGYDEKIGMFMYNKGQSRSGDLSEIIAKDHPEGLKAAMKNSMKMQKSTGVMSKGFVPNFVKRKTKEDDEAEVQKSRVEAMRVRGQQANKERAEGFEKTIAFRKENPRTYSTSLGDTAVPSNMFGEALPAWEKMLAKQGRLNYNPEEWNKNYQSFMSQNDEVMDKSPKQDESFLQKSFTQQEAGFNNNTSALTSLAGGIESLNSTLTNFGGNFGNSNNVPGQQPTNAQNQTNAQPNVTTTVNAPVTVPVSVAGGGTDVASEVAKAIQNAIPEIVEKVRIAQGEKVPPKSNSTPT